MANKRPYRSTLREKAKINTQNSILEAAVKLHGQGDTSVESLAEEAGVSVPTIRKYFPTKENLFEGCTNHFMQTYTIPSLEAMNEIGDPRDRMVNVVEEIYGFIEMTMGFIWLGYQLQDESDVMKKTIAELESYCHGAAAVVLKDHPFDRERKRKESLGLVTGLLSPLTYRSLRLIGGLKPEQCIRHTVRIVGSILFGEPDGCP